MGVGSGDGPSLHLSFSGADAEAWNSFQQLLSPLDRQALDRLQPNDQEFIRLLAKGLNVLDADELRLVKEGLRGVALQGIDSSYGALLTSLTLRVCEVLGRESPLA
ncbi:MAG: hypothetical protein HYS86_01935 [Candidatus Chisholmbacteria bacterium]|nr:hypothetical protein [Candidatus Chisholmbacteria bacterium]